MIVEGQHVKGRVEYKRNATGGTDAVVHVPNIPMFNKTIEVKANGKRNI